MTLTERQEELCEQSTGDFSDLRTLFINCTLKKSPEVSHTEGLANVCVHSPRANLEVHAYRRLSIRR